MRDDSSGSEAREGVCVCCVRHVCPESDVLDDGKSFFSSCLLSVLVPWSILLL